MSYDAILITALSGFLGAAIGSITTLWLHFKNKKNDERKILNESIHYLLEVFFLVNRFDVEKMTSAYLDYFFMQIKKISPKLNEDSLKNIKEQITSIMKSTSVPLAQKQTFENFRIISRDYENMLTKLATILPIDAFYLRGKNKLEALINTASLYFDSIQIANSENAEAIRTTINQMQPSIITSLINEFKKDLETELLVLLKKTDRYNCKKGKKAIAMVKSVELTDYDKREIDSIISNILNQLKQNPSK